MSITTKPESIMRREGDDEWTLTPVAFRASRRHPWRSYEDGNPRYLQDWHHFHDITNSVDDAGEVLWIRTHRWLGFSCEGNCSECGACLWVSLPFDWTPAAIDLRCCACAAKSNDGQPQDAVRPYTPEYQAAQRSAMGAK